MGLSNCYLIFILFEKMFHILHVLMFDPHSETFSSGWSGESLNRTSIAYSLLDLTFTSSSSMGSERSGVVDVPTSSSTSNNLFSSFGSSTMGVSSLRVGSKETSLGLSNLFWMVSSWRCTYLNHGKVRDIRSMKFVLTVLGFNCLE